MFYTIVRRTVWFLALLVWNIKFEGRQNIPLNGGYIFVSNHRNNLDPVFITIPIRARFAYMAKEELFRVPVLKSVITALGAYPVSRGSGDFSVLDRGVAEISRGRNLMLFPEGTRSKDGKIGRFKSGVAVIAAKSDADVVPVGITYQTKKNGKPKFGFRARIAVRYGEVISSKELVVSDVPTTKELRHIKNLLLGKVKNLVDEPQQSVKI
ncbi:MAG: 1-acyl-sn-glycerol-3-phosphate acyltransferase [Ruminococcus sp.]|jgi:1-acyl-sn-glycerol-3-phosphate acyltransferase|nr:1-acyl-sn-glycerol-3-phosphate acyltransferase [Ruminococcus sp.]